MKCLRKSLIVKNKSLTMTSTAELCLRQGYQCSCSTCAIWIARWNKELEAFSTVDLMLNEGKNLFQIYERLRAEHPDILRLHHVMIEKQYIDFKNITG